MLRIAKLLKVGRIDCRKSVKFDFKQPLDVLREKSCY